MTSRPSIDLAAEKPDRERLPNDPAKKPDHEDDIPDTPPTEPKPAPVQDPRPPGQPPGPYVAR